MIASKQLRICLCIVMGMGLFFMRGAGTAAPAPRSVVYGTVITVTSGLDHTTDGVLTLRQAVLNARNAAKPVLIEFDIPTTCLSYDDALKVWKIVFEGLAPGGGGATLRQLNGGITIDGTTQPGGRTAGPKIILQGHSLTGAEKGLVLGETSTQNGNVIRGLAFQNFNDHLTISSQQNLVEYCWFGLNDAGTEPMLRGGNPASGSGVSGVVFAQISLDNNRNVIRHNVFLGLNGTAATIRGRDNTFSDNFVGTRADGTVVGAGCTPDSWLGGGGIVVQGRRHRIENNTFAGLRFDQFIISQPPDAIRVTVDDVAGAGHTIIDNRIGIDAGGTVVGTCGRGILLSNHMRGTLVQDNTIVATSLSGITMNGLLYNECELRGNVIQQTEIEYSPSLPDAFKTFRPPKVTAIEGTTVSGTAGDGSPCPNGWVELFLDESESPAEARQSLARVQADAESNWTATIPFELAADQGIRTMLTTTAFGTIPNMRAGTSTGLSEIYRLEREGLPLRIGRLTPTSALVTWPVAGSDGYVLQHATTLLAHDWSNVAVPSVSVGDERQVTVTPLVGVRFYRLRKE